MTPENRNLIMAVALSMIVLLGWQIFVIQPEMEREAAEQERMARIRKEEEELEKQQQRLLEQQKEWKREREIAELKAKEQTSVASGMVGKGRLSQSTTLNRSVGRVGLDYEPPAEPGKVQRKPKSRHRRFSLEELEHEAREKAEREEAAAKAAAKAARQSRMQKPQQKETSLISAVNKRSIKAVEVGDDGEHLLVKVTPRRQSCGCGAPALALAG